MVSFKKLKYGTIIWVEALEGQFQYVGPCKYDRQITSITRLAYVYLPIEPTFLKPFSGDNKKHVLVFEEEIKCVMDN